MTALRVVSRYSQQEQFQITLFLILNPTGITRYVQIYTIFFQFFHFLTKGASLNWYDVVYISIFFSPFPQYSIYIFLSFLIPHLPIPPPPLPFFFSFLTKPSLSFILPSFVSSPDCSLAFSPQILLLFSPSPSSSLSSFLSPPTFSRPSLNQSFLYISIPFSLPFIFSTLSIPPSLCIPSIPNTSPLSNPFTKGLILIKFHITVIKFHWVCEVIIFTKFW